MHEFYNARSVAVIGVSNSQGNLGRIMVYNLLEFRYQGIVYVVGPKGGSFLGHRIYPSVLDIPDSVDLAAILVPAAAVPDVLRQCGDKGIRRVVVESAGFRELGEDRMALEGEVRSILEEYGMRMIGPNCIGIMNRYTGLAVPFMPFKAEAPPGRVGIISQSGGVGGAMINSLAAENIGFSKFASVGNKLDVNESDLLEYMASDDETGIVFCYLEGIANGRHFMEIASRCPKPVVVHKSNRSSQGSAIARSHSASLSTDDRVVDAAFRQCGIIRSYGQRESIEKVKAFSLPRMRGNRLAIISRSGGHAVIAVDAAEELGFLLPPFPDDLIQRIQEASRARVIQFHNPLDLGDLFNLSLYRTLAEKTLEREDIDGILFIHNYQGIFDAEDSRRLIDGFGALMEKYKKPVALCIFTMKAEFEYNRKAVNFPIFDDPGEAVRALACSRDWHRRSPIPLSSQRPPGIDVLKARSELDRVSAGPVPPDSLASMLAAYGIPLVPWRKAESARASVDAAQELGFPVVLKTASPQIIHKSDVGGVCLNLSDEPSILSAYECLQRMDSRVLVQKMADQGLEWFVGGRQDENFGPVLVVGLGGIYIEVFRETAIRVAPIAYEEAERVLEESRGAPLLRGVRGESPLDRRGLMEVMVRISWLLYDFPEIGEIDLNPVRVLPGRCMALDWRAVKSA